MIKVHYPKPKKMSGELLLEDVEKHRRFDCIFYDFCLDHAVGFFYQTFSCTDCTYYHKKETNIMEALAFQEMGKLILSKKEIKDENNNR